jgi:hypothetical protein
MVVFALWPVAQITLSALYDVNPWKLAGWGMYAAPQLPAAVRVYGITADDVGLYELGTLPPDLDLELQEFLVKRHALRNMVEPDGFAQAMLRHYRAIDGVRVVVEKPVLNRRTGMIELRSMPYEYRRGGASPD